MGMPTKPREQSIPGIPKEFEYKKLRRWTNHFDEKMKLGQGGRGEVYRATVPSEHGKSIEVAVKRLSWTTWANPRRQEDFLAEISIMNRLRHRNLVPLVGWCQCEENYELLVLYDFMPNGSLDKHLFGNRDVPILTWKQRYTIVVGVASALNYLHHEYDQMVIHRDIKPSNIMLDAAFNAQLSDLRLADALDSDKTILRTDKIGVTGTLGYIAPECFHTHTATWESDVYSFGAVILEIVSGRRIFYLDDSRCLQLLEAVQKLHDSGAGRVLEAVDPRLAGEFDKDGVGRLLLLGLACCHPDPQERPNAKAIVQILARSAPPPDVPLSEPSAFRDEPDDELTTFSHHTSSSGWTKNSHDPSSSGWTTSSNT